MKGFKEFYATTRKILVEVPENIQLNEATRSTVGKYTARRDPGHFDGDEYHAHAETPGGYEVAWGISGSRRHPQKFPAKIPADAKAAVAKVLGISVDLLEAFTFRDETIGEDVLLLEIKAS